MLEHENTASLIKSELMSNIKSIKKAIDQSERNKGLQILYDKLKKDSKK